jgi:hypothetical protein
MSSDIDLETQAVLDAAIKMLYKSRPAKAAALLGLVPPPPEESTLKLGAANPGTLPSMTMFPSKAPKDAGLPQGDNAEMQNQLGSNSSINLNTAIDPNKGPLGPPTSARSVSPSIAVGDGINPNTGHTNTASLYKRAMTEAELLQYYGGAGDLMEATGDPSLTPAQMGMIGAGGVGITAANRGRAKSIAGRELRGVRNQYLQAVQEGALDKQRLRLLNKELKLRGARPTLSLAPTAGIADAQMVRAERDLGSKILKKRYKGAIPLIAASLLGTLAYNQFS